MTPSPRTRRLLALLWTLGIVVGCTLPGDALPSASLWKLDKLWHFLLFAGQSVLWMAASAAPLRRRAAVVLAASLAFAVLTELYQGLLPFGRHPDLLDAAADAAGAAAGLLAYLALFRRPPAGSSRPEGRMAQPPR